MIGIYKITNKINGKSYIGQSVEIYKRWQAHINAAIRGGNTHFYYALRKYGVDNFKFEVIEECTKDQLNDREIYWIEFFDTFNNGYNSLKGGQFSKGTTGKHWKMSDETKKKMSDAAKGKPKSKEHAQHISEGQRGKPKSPEACKRMSDAAKQRPHEYYEELMKKRKQGVKGKHRCYREDGTYFYA